MKVENSYNSDGNLLSIESWFQPKDQAFMSEDGYPRWSEFIQFGDECGFDIRHKTDSGRYYEKIVLPHGKKVIRYGNDGGSFTTDEGEDYEKLSLPYVKQTVPYHEYVVSGYCEVECLVDKGIVAPGFGSIGGAIQYRHYISIHESLLKGILTEDFSWLLQRI